LAALALLGAADRIDADKLASWVVHRQMRFEGGFQGRPNKLVDGCYSFWVGGVYPLLQPLLKSDSTLYRPAYLQDYILRCCQAPMGGLRDKPGKNRDYYHTCYCLSGLSSSQHFSTKETGSSACDVLRPTHSLFNVTLPKADAIIAFFKERPL
jgi:protein farnesyltransferase subunit beta